MIQHTCAECVYTVTFRERGEYSKLSDIFPKRCRWSLCSVRTRSVRLGPSILSWKNVRGKAKFQSFPPNRKGDRAYLGGGSIIL